MFALIRSLLPPLASLALMLMASGLFNTFVSVRLEMEGYTPDLIGLVASSLYVGILAGSLRIDRWIASVGHIRSFIAFAAVSAVLVLLQALWIDPWFWCALRFLGGVCTAGIFIAIESWLLMKSAPEFRGAILSIYLAVFYGALSLGQFFINLSPVETAFPFCITALLVTLSLIPISVRKVAEPAAIEKPVRLNLAQLFRLSPLGFIGGIVSGMLLAAVYGLLPVYAKEMGMNVSEIGTLMGVLIFGGFLLQWPMGRWADKSDRRRVLNAASFLAACLALALAFAGTVPFLLYLLAALFGGVSFTLYPLSMAFACERAREDQIVAVTGGFVLSYGLGAIAGPLIAPFAMGLFGSPGLFYFLSAITLSLGLFGLKRPAKEIKPSNIDIDPSP